MCKLKGWMDKGGYDNVEMKGGWKKWHYDVSGNLDGGWIGVGIKWKSKGGCKRGYYEVQIKRADG